MSSSEPAASNRQTEPVKETTVAERGGLRRRVAGAQLPGSVPGSVPNATSAPRAAQTTRSKPAARPPERDAARDRGVFDGYQSAFARASEHAVSPAGQTSPNGTRSGLTRRVPGESMAPGLRVAKPGRPPARMTTKWQERDPAADRTKLDEYMTGLSRASMAPNPKEVDG